MSKIICRLCLKDGKLINIFDSRLTNSEQLRKCIVLGTGVEIRPDDLVTKYVCEGCSELAIFLYKYRKRATAIDKALKAMANQPFERSAHTNDIVALNRAVLNELVEEDADGLIGKLIMQQKLAAVPKGHTSPDLAVHPTIIDLIKTYPKIKIPNDILKSHIWPTVLLDADEVQNWMQQQPRQSPEEVRDVADNDFERFKMMCPEISIVKVSQDDPEVSTTDKESIKRKLSDLPCNIDAFKRKRCDSVMSNASANSSKSSKRRAQTPGTFCSSDSADPLFPRLRNLLIDGADTTSLLTESNSNSHQEIASASIVKILKQTSNQHASSTELPVPVEELAGQKYQESTFNSTLDPILQPEVGESESLLEEIIQPRKTKRKRLLSSESEVSLYHPDSPMNDSLLDTVDEEVVIHCGICNKLFNTSKQLKVHERGHRYCIVCGNIFSSEENLRFHQQDICFKKVVANPPRLQLIKVDEQPEVVSTYPEAFQLEQEETIVIAPDLNEHIMSDDDDDVILIEDSTTPAPTGINSGGFLSNSPEFQYICQIFRKYNNKPIPKVHKNTETKPRIFVSYNQRNQIVLENMYAELQSFRVPVELIAKPTSFAYISFNKKRRTKKDFYCWATEPVIGLSQKEKILLNQPMQSRTTYSGFSSSQPGPIQSTVISAPPAIGSIRISSISTSPGSAARNPQPPQLRTIVPVSSAISAPPGPSMLSVPAVIPVSSVFSMSTRTVQPAVVSVASTTLRPLESHMPPNTAAPSVISVFSQSSTQSKTLLPSTISVPPEPSQPSKAPQEPQSAQLATSSQPPRALQTSRTLQPLKLPSKPPAYKLPKTPPLLRTSLPLRTILPRIPEPPQTSVVTFQLPTILTNTTPSDPVQYVVTPSSESSVLATNVPTASNTAACYMNANEPVASTSGVNRESGFSLRVKTLHELNKF